jgi:hypothetical protein
MTSWIQRLLMEKENYTIVVLLLIFVNPISV